jgi:hypothetical protein
MNYYDIPHFNHWTNKEEPMRVLKGVEAKLISERMADVYELKVGDTFPVTGFSFKNMEAEVFLPKGNGVINFGIGIEIELVFEEPTQSIAAQEPAPAIIPDAPNVKKFFQKEQATEKKETLSEEDSILQLLDLTEDRLNEAASKDIELLPALISRFDSKNNDIVPIIEQGTVNTVQGKHGSHKSRLVENFCSMLLAKKNTEFKFLGFTGNKHLDVAVLYLDTERPIKTQFPLALQRIRKHAGFDRFESIPNFYYNSIMKVKRAQRLLAVKLCIEKTRLKTSLPLFVILDVVTDCVESFNNEAQSMGLFDELAIYCDNHNATFLIVLHENPGSEKGRGHTGTEAANKSSTVIQIGYLDRKKSDTIQIAYLKNRSSAPPPLIYVSYDKEINNLVLMESEELAAAQEYNKYNITEFKGELQYIIKNKNVKGVTQMIKHFENYWHVSTKTAHVKFSELIETVVAEEHHFYFGNETFILIKAPHPTDKRSYSFEFQALEILNLKQKALDYVAI